DTYLVVQDENYLWELCGKDYTIQYTVSYESFADVRRYACVLWNYYGQYYNSFHLRVNGTGNLQGHMAGAWLDHDRYTPATDLYSGSSDGDGGTSIANKLLGLSLDGNTGDVIFRDVEVTVRIRISESGATSVWLSCGGDFVEVARYDASSEIGDGLNSHLSRCNGGALAIKTGAGINATLDELMVYMGHGDEPRDKTVTYTPGELPEIKVEFDLTQESVLSSGKYSDSKYSSFNAISYPEWVVPALKQGMIPQGMDIWEEKNLLVISGYFRDYSLIPSSVLVTVDLTTGKLVGEYLLKNADGTYHTSHVGGVAVSDRNLYIANGSYLYRIPISALNDAGNHGTLKIVESITVPVRASFCNVSDGVLWVGDFYIPNDATYKTPEWRHMTNRDGKTYGGLCVGYRLDDKTESGITVDAWREGMECSTPDVALSITQKIQGFTIVGDKIALSQSYGRTNNATILLYHNVLSEPEHSEIKINDTLVPVWFLDSKAEAGSYVTMPMTEGLATHNGDLLILYESGASYYKDNGGKNPTDRVWRMDLK
ncbi:MAG: hypothetical protein J6B77_02825, partial [Clostridia bacterium]|nr:hypothetical protein [Clostridia bacterium]